MRGSGRRSAGPPMSKFCRELMDLRETSAIVSIIELTVASEHPSICLRVLAVLRRYPSQHEIAATTRKFQATDHLLASLVVRTIKGLDVVNSLEDWFGILR